MMQVITTVHLDGLLPEEKAKLRHCMRKRIVFLQPVVVQQSTEENILREWDYLM